MTGTSALRSINCTQCGAPLTLRGGHRVESITCGFCGSVLDTHEDFKVLKTYADIKRPYLPFGLGQQGTIKDVEFTIIGTVQYQDDWGERWLDMALFSPTHGYAWLEYANGHFLFSRRIRDLPESPIVNRAKSKFDACGHEFTVFSRYNARVTFVEGELTYVAEIGDKVALLDAIAPPYMYTVERNETEEEYLLGEYLEPADVYENFGADEAQDDRVGVHPAQPFTASPWLKALTPASLIFTPIAVLLLLYSVVFGMGSVAVDADMAPNKRAKGGLVMAEKNFKVSSDNALVNLQLRVPSKTDKWAAFDVRVVQNNENIFSLDKQLAATGANASKRQYWRKRGTEIETHFHLPKAGIYTLQVLAKIPGRKPKSIGPLRVKLREGVRLSRYYLALLVLTSLVFILAPMQMWRFEARRWEDEDDEDD
jgi:hypothetical protein